jgi:L-lactate dehydrogenase complex protein LldG
MSASARDELLAALRAVSMESPPLPPLPGFGVTYADKVAQFSTAIEAVGGRAVRGEIAATLRTLPAFTSARRICALLDGVPGANVSLETVADPHALEDLDVTVAPGALGVAENGAIWIPGATARHPAALFLCQHLVLVLRADAIVDNMHDAYGRIAAAAHPYGVFISGPSKTADIEQSLVIGAHGPRSATIILTS